MTISSIKFSFTIFCCHSHNSRTQLCSMKLKLLWMGYAWSWIPRWELQTHFQCLKGAHRDRYSPCLPYRTPLGCVSLPIFHMASQGPCSPCLAGPGKAGRLRDIDQATQILKRLLTLHYISEYLSLSSPSSCVPSSKTGIIPSQLFVSFFA